MSKPLLAVLFLLSAGCSTETQNSETRDSNSNWLTACSDNADCDPQDTCVNERCHAACDDGHGCEGTASECRVVSSSDGCVAPNASASGYCFVPCSKASDCDRLGDGFRCEQGVCSSEPRACGSQPTEPQAVDAGPDPFFSGPDVVSMSPERPQPGSGAADAAAAPDPDLVDAGTDATPDCPVVADQCPPECAAVESSPLHPVALCFMPSEILGCADPNPGSTTDDNCLRRSDGALFPGISGAFAGPLVASGEFAPCTTEENDRVSQAIGTCESSPENPEPVQPGVVQCSIVADACPAECAVIESAPLLAGESCYSPVTTLGCFDASVASTADGNCLRRSDGALFVDISGTFADPMIASGEFALCTDADFERATQAVGVSCESPSNPEPSPDAGTVPPDVKYSAQITNGIDCCDFYTVVKADPVLDLCLFAEVREELGSAPVLSSASALESANDCWNRLQEPRTEASTITGDVSFSFDATPATATFQLTADFTNPPSWLPERVTASFESLPLDGEWYPRQ